MSQRCGLPVILCAIWMGAVVGCGEDAESGDMNVCHWDDIELGMTMQQVTDLVGEPEEIIEPDEDVPSTAWWYQGVMYGGRAKVCGHMLVDDVWIRFQDGVVIDVSISVSINGG